MKESPNKNKVDGALYKSADFATFQNLEFSDEKKKYSIQFYNHDKEQEDNNIQVD